MFFTQKLTLLGHSCPNLSSSTVEFSNSVNYLQIISADELSKPSSQIYSRLWL